jgi:hypothetical protein
MDRPDLVALELGVPPEAWADLGFAVDADARSRIGGVELALGAGRAGITRWSLRGVGPADDGIDGLQTTVVATPEAPVEPSAHPNGATAIDHVVVATPNHARTLQALAAVGLAVRAERDAGSAERPLRQAFLLTRQALVEVVGPPEPAGDEPASFWGLTVAVADLDATAALLGTRLGSVRDAVQPGRRIATVRREAAAGLHLAFMDLRVSA